MFSNKDGRFTELLKKVEGKGFYIILSLCVIAIGVSGYVLFFTNTIDSEDFDLGDIDSGTVFLPEDPPDGDEPVIWNPVITDPDEDKPVSGVEDGDTPADAGKPVSGETDKPVSVTAKAVAPTKGEVIKPFSGDKLVYDQTMCDWRTHNGTDFSCTQGDTVYEDGLMGHTVTVEHVGGLISSYSGLSSASAVKKGDTLKMGDAIGTAGGTAIAESNQPYHVHVSVSQDGRFIDVMSLF